MYSEVFSTTIFGLSAEIVRVETDAGAGLPFFEMSGYLAAQVREAKERVRVAIKNSGIEMFPQRIVVNISPADIRKAGTGFDLPIAVGLLAANERIQLQMLPDTVILGELSLDGRVNSVRGVLPGVLAAKQAGFVRCIVPWCNLQEGSVVEGIEVYGVRNLKELIAYLNGQGGLTPGERQEELFMKKQGRNIPALDFSEISGQTAAKRATLIAAAGMHNILYVGAPGSGKTMLAQRIPTIMPSLTFKECLSVTRIYSVAGKLDRDAPLVFQRPFRCPHHSVTPAALLGGGTVPVPGEITLASKGVLFLDELTEYRQDLIEALRQPLEEHMIRIVRLSHEYIYPADCMLVAAMNPCKCGFYPDRTRCRCSEQEIRRYLGRISQPVWDRFDLGVSVEPVKFNEMSAPEEHQDMVYTSEHMRLCVEQARKAQLQRFGSSSLLFNAQMSPAQVREFCALGPAEKKRMEQVYTKLNLTARGYHKVLKTARTIADLEGEEQISIRHLSEAISYRSYGCQ